MALDIGLLGIKLPPSPSKPKFTSLRVFGDSLSDVGNLSTFTYNGSGGQFWFPPSPPLPSPDPPFANLPPNLYYSKVPYYNSVTDWEKRHPPSPGSPLPFTPADPPKVRASNGPIWADIFPKNLGLSQQVSNFAYAGATTGSTNGLQPFLPPLPSPYNNYNKLPGLLDEIGDFTAKSGKADSKGLYVVWAGANDGFNLAGSLAPPGKPIGDLRTVLPTIAGAVKTAVNNIETAITSLAKKGAHTFLVPNLADLGATPLLRQSKDSAFVGTAFSVLFDVALAAKLPTLERSLKIDIIEPDVYTLSQEALKRPQEFGLKNTVDPLIGQYPANPNVKPDDFFWYDYQHPSAKVQEVLADFFQDNIFAAGYTNKLGSTSNLPPATEIKMAAIAKEPILAGNLVQGISDLTSLGLNQGLLSGLGADCSFLPLGLDAGRTLTTALM